MSRSGHREWQDLQSKVEGLDIYWWIKLEKMYQADRDKVASPLKHRSVTQPLLL